MCPEDDRRSSLTFHGEVAARGEVPGFSIELLQLSPCQFVSKHSHLFTSVFVLLNGTCVTDSDLGRANCQPGSVIFHPVDEPHSEHYGNGVRARALAVAVPASTVAKLSPYNISFQKPREAHGAITAHLGYRLGAALSQPDSASALTIEGLLYELLGEVLGAPRDNAKKPPRLDQAVALLNDRFTESISLATIAREVDLHPTYLAREFRRRHRVTVGEYIRQRRVEYACARLIASSVPLSQVALEAGFTDHSHFCYIFKKCIGVTPRQFREAHRR